MGNRVTIPDTLPVGVGSDPASRGELSADRPSSTNSGRGRAPRPLPYNDFLSKLRMLGAEPFVWIGLADYTNVANTRRVLVDKIMPPGFALVITQLQPVYFVGAGTALVEIDNPWLMVYDANDGQVPHKFDITTGGNAIGETVMRVTDGATTTDVAGVIPALPFTSFLGWDGAMWTSIVRGGGRLVVESIVLTAIDADIGATIPDAVGMKVGGMKIAESVLNEALKT